MSSSKLLDGKVALVTGAGRGIGLATARAFARHGASVILNARTAGSLDALAEELSAETGSPCAASYFDVADPDGVKAAFTAISRSHPGLDVLVNNAGILRDALFAMTTPETIRDVFATNVFGAMYCAQYAARLMSRRRQGSIITISSIIGTHGNDGQTAYGASKAAVIGMTKSLAKEIAPSGVRVNAVAPGFIDTDMIRAVPEAKAERIRGNIRMGRLGTPEDIADVCVFLASDLSRYVTGQVIGVDGGMIV
jgi:3-oxoacyl-[acyl-carrier protein] reductase